MRNEYAWSNASPWVKVVPLMWWGYVWLRYHAVTVSLLLYLTGAGICLYKYGPYGLVGAAALFVPTAALVGFEIVFGRVWGPALFGFIVTWIVQNKGWDLLYGVLDIAASGH